MKSRLIGSTVRISFKEHNIKEADNYVGKVVATEDKMIAFEFDKGEVIWWPIRSIESLKEIDPPTE